MLLIKQKGSLITRCWCDRFWQLSEAGIAGCIGILTFTGAIASAQIIPDATLGAEGSLVTPLDPDFAVDAIVGGTFRGTNLFHSFQEFNVAQGRGAYFFSPAGIENILTRVTGNNPSNILGVLGTFGPAQPNLFLINPNGILFRPNARLDVDGSFVATTANALQFGDRGFFSATDPEIPSSLLTINPSALLLNQSATHLNHSIENRGYLRVPNGQSLLLVGGDVRLDRGILAAFGGRVELGGLADSGSIGLNFDYQGPKLQSPAGTRTNVSLTNRSIIDVSYDNGGDVSIYAKNLELLSNSGIYAGIDGGVGSAESQAGDINLNVTDTIRLESGGFVQNDVNSSEIGNGGNLNVTTGSLFLSDRAYLSASTFGNGNAGSVIINARDRISLDNNAIILSDIREDGNGRTGGVDISTDTLDLRGGSQVSSAITKGRGFAGDVRIRAQAITIDNQGLSLLSYSSITSGVGFRGFGRGGDIEIDTETLQLLNGAEIFAGVTGIGLGGNVRIRAQEIILAGQDPNNTFIDTGSKITSRLGVSGSIGEADGTRIPFGIGRAGNVEIQARRLTLRDDAAINAFSAGEGDAGNVRIQAETVTLSNASDIFSNSTGFGDAGDIEVQTESLHLRDGSQFLAFTEGSGKAGNIRVTATDTVELIGSNPVEGKPTALFTDNDTDSPGVGGNITVMTNRFRVADGAIVDARTRNQSAGGDITINANVFEALNGGQLISTSQGSGRAGTITVNANQQLRIDGSDPNYEARSVQFGRNRIGTVEAASGIFVRSQAGGSAGDILINAPTIQLDHGGKLNAESFSGNGGNISVQSSQLLLLRRNSSISTNAGTDRAGGNGGNIIINTPLGFVVAIPQENSDITANAFKGNGGNVNITAQGIFGLQFRPELTPLSDITASSQFGISGSVAINSPDTSSLQNSLTELPQNLIDTSNLIANSCIARSTQQTGSFLVTGAGGLPVRPGDAAVSSYPTGSIRSVSSGVSSNGSGSTTPVRSWQKGDAIVEPQGVYRLANGQLVMSRECSE